MSETVKSPAGETVEIFDDDEFKVLMGFDESQSQRAFTFSMGVTAERFAVLRALWEHGKFVDKSGRASIHVAEYTLKHYGVPILNPSAVFSAPSLNACLSRDIRGKRTSRIQLVALPVRWHAIVTGNEQPHIYGSKPTPQLVEVVRSLDDARDARAALPPPPTAPAAPSPVDEHRRADVEHEVADAVATALMARVVEIITTNHGNIAAQRAAQARDEVRQLEKRLGEQVAYVERLRRDLRSVQDELSAIKLERDGLRQRLRTAEFNLQTATGADAQRLIDAEVHRQVDRMMRQAPTTKGREA